MVRVPRTEVPYLLRRLRSIGAMVRISGKMAGHLRRYEIRHPAHGAIEIEERSNTMHHGLTAAPTMEQVALNLMAVECAHAIMQKRLDELQQLVDKERQPKTQHLIIGAGLCGTMTYHTLPFSRGYGVAPGVDPQEIPAVMNISASPDPWRSRAIASPIGQPVTEWQSPGLTRQAGEFTTDHTGFGYARDIAYAIALTAFESGMMTYYGRVTALDVAPDQSWPRDVQCRIRVVNDANFDGKYIYTDRCDLAVGLGPARRLTAEQLSHTDEALLRAAGALLYGQEHLEGAQPLRSRQVSGDSQAGAPYRVLIIGGGATAAWNAERVVQDENVRVVWLGRPTKLDEYRGAESKAIEALRGRMGLSTGEQARLRDLWAFRDARNTRNESIFQEPRIERRMGEVGQILHVGGGAQVKVKGQAPDDDFEETFDQVIVSIGQDMGRVDDHGPASAWRLVKDAKLELQMILDKGRLVGLESVEPQGMLRVLGAAMHAGLLRLLNPKDHNKYRQLLFEQANDASVPQHSQGVPGSIYQIGQDVPRANALL